MFNDGTEWNETGESNAHLIAAAPDMLEALDVAERMLRYLLDVPTNAAGAKPTATILRTLWLVRGALAKARGQ